MQASEREQQKEDESGWMDQHALFSLSLSLADTGRCRQSEREISARAQSRLQRQKRARERESLCAAGAAAAHTHTNGVHISRRQEALTPALVPDPLSFSLFPSLSLAIYPRIWIASLSHSQGETTVAAGTGARVQGEMRADTDTHACMHAPAAAAAAGEGRRRERERERKGSSGKAARVPCSASPAVLPFPSCSRRRSETRGRDFSLDFSQHKVGHVSTAEQKQQQRQQWQRRQSSLG